VTDPAHPDHTCPTCGVSIDRRAAACRKHRAALFTPDTARAAVEARWEKEKHAAMNTTIDVAYHDSQGPVYVMHIPDEMMRQLDLHVDDVVRVTLQRVGDEVTATLRKEAPRPAAGEEKE
jgi:hypothetical protein